MSGPTVRAKFRVSGLEDFGYSKQVKFTAVYEGPLGDNEENKRFTNATPNGELKMAVDNPYAWKQFELGQEWYLDFTKAQDASS
jgi:hypothetical protein